MDSIHVNWYQSNLILGSIMAETSSSELRLEQSRLRLEQSQKQLEETMKNCREQQAASFMSIQLMLSKLAIQWKVCHPVADDYIFSEVWTTPEIEESSSFHLEQDVLQIDEIDELRMQMEADALNVRIGEKQTSMEDFPTETAVRDDGLQATVIAERLISRDGSPAIVLDEGTFSDPEAEGIPEDEPEAVPEKEMEVTVTSFDGTYSLNSMSHFQVSTDLVIGKYEEYTCELDFMISDKQCVEKKSKGKDLIASAELDSLNVANVGVYENVMCFDPGIGEKLNLGSARYDTLGEIDINLVNKMTIVDPYYHENIDKNVMRSARKSQLFECCEIAELKSVIGGDFESNKCDNSEVSEVLGLNEDGSEYCESEMCYDPGITEENHECLSEVQTKRNVTVESKENLARVSIFRDGYLEVEIDGTEVCCEAVQGMSGVNVGCDFIDFDNGMEELTNPLSDEVISLKLWEYSGKSRNGDLVASRHFGSMVKDEEAVVAQTLLMSLMALFEPILNVLNPEQVKDHIVSKYLARELDSHSINELGYWSSLCYHITGSDDLEKCVSRYISSYDAWNIVGEFHICFGRRRILKIQWQLRLKASGDERTGFYNGNDVHEDNYAQMVGLSVPIQGFTIFHTFSELISVTKASYFAKSGWGSLKWMGACYNITGCIRRTPNSWNVYTTTFKGGARVLFDGMSWCKNLVAENQLVTAVSDELKDGREEISSRIHSNFTTPTEKFFPRLHSSHLKSSCADFKCIKLGTVREPLHQEYEDHPSELCHVRNESNASLLRSTIWKLITQNDQAMIWLICSLSFSLEIGARMWFSLERGVKMKYSECKQPEVRISSVLYLFLHELEDKLKFNKEGIYGQKVVLLCINEDEMLSTVSLSTLIETELGLLKEGGFLRYQQKEFEFWLKKLSGVLDKLLQKKRDISELHLQISGLIKSWDKMATVFRGGTLCLMGLWIYKGKLLKRNIQSDAISWPILQMAALVKMAHDYGDYLCLAARINMKAIYGDKLSLVHRIHHIKSIKVLLLYMHGTFFRWGAADQRTQQVG